MLERPTPLSREDFSLRCPRALDPFEAFLPSQPGFIQDFVIGLYNSEVPVAYSAWSAVWCLAMAIKREAWVKWFKDDPLFPNFYIILSGPPSSKKGKAVGRAVRVYKSGIGPVDRPIKGEAERPYEGKLSEPWVRAMKTHVPLIMDFSTTRPLKAALSWRGRRGMGTEKGSEVELRDADGELLHNEDGSIWKYTKTSEIGVVTEELSTFLGKQKYNEGLVPLMLAIYNTDLDKEDRTDAHGIVSMRSLCTNWLAGTTADSFQDAVSDTAKGDGFFSRATIVHQDRRWQRFFPPPDWPWLPGPDELGTRLAYVAETTLGEHVLTPGALALAKTWYDAHVESLEAQVEYAHFWSRKDIQLLKLALIMKAQRYPAPGDFDITEDDLADAIRLLDATAKFAPRIMEPTSAPQRMRDIKKFERILSAGGPEGVSRARLQRSTHLPAGDMDVILSELLRYGKIHVIAEGEKREFLSEAPSAKDIYVWAALAVDSLPEDEEEREPAPKRKRTPTSRGRRK